MNNNFTPIAKLEHLMKQKYHPQIFTSFDDFTSYAKMNKEITISNYTDGQIKNDDLYKIFIFTDPQDFTNTPLIIDDFLTEIYVSYDNHGCIKDMFITGIEMDAMKDASMFYRESLPIK